MPILLSNTYKQRILIARHANTFDKGEQLLRVGAKTNLPLSVSGKEQAVRLGQMLAQFDMKIDKVWVSNLVRTQQTANIALETAKFNLTPIITSVLDEVDYGVDEGQPETKVIARLGKEALLAWEQDSIVPAGWNIDVATIVANLHNLINNIQERDVLIVTSNGIARFLPQVLNLKIAKTELKLNTAALGCASLHTTWDLDFWNKSELG